MEGITELPGRWHILPAEKNVLKSARGVPYIPIRDGCLRPKGITNELAEQQSSVLMISLYLFAIYNANQINFLSKQLLNQLRKTHVSTEPKNGMKQNLLLPNNIFF